MYEQLTLAHRLYSINEQQLSDFQQLAKHFTFQHDLSQQLSMRSLDNYAVVLHIWCMFKEDVLNLYFLPDKVMPYSCNHYCLNLLKNDNEIKRFADHKLKDDEFLFVLSYFLSYVMLLWVHELLLEASGGNKEIQDNMNRDYFLYADNEEIIFDDQHHFYDNQKFVTHLLASDFSKTSRYNNYIKKALSLTRAYLFDWSKYSSMK